VFLYSGGWGCDNFFSPWWWLWKGRRQVKLKRRQIYILVFKNFVWGKSYTFDLFAKVWGRRLAQGVLHEGGRKVGEGEGRGVDALPFKYLLLFRLILTNTLPFQYLQLFWLLVKFWQILRRLWLPLWRILDKQGCLVETILGDQGQGQCQRIFYEQAQGLGQIIFDEQGQGLCQRIFLRTGSGWESGGWPNKVGKIPTLPNCARLELDLQWICLSMIFNTW